MEAEIIRQFGNHCRINKFGRDAELFCIILLSIVIPAEAGIQYCVDSRLCGNDRQEQAGVY